MPLAPVTCGTFYGLPFDVEVECSEHPCVDVHGLVFISVRVLVMYNAGLPDGLVVQEFLSVHVRRDGRMIGMLLPPPADAPGWV
ncbi:hypothetical protein EUGRSUZ_G00526 [Eucalyptus grandis]|uniref:Uncharacterized protein n=2 Tax=Eucalyptus grandis TaxID=71139 RepID=A0ACC3K0B7_EUCGR|nr:hypothetical protein EUGRSUZ_G00526 [Eucalyptus grandis]